MNCPRCNGLMISDVYTACQWSNDDPEAVYYRCVCCGNAVDELIMQHKRLNVKVTHE